MSELPPNQCSIPSADADLGRRQPAAHEASGAQTFGGTSRRKRNVARKIYDVSLAQADPTLPNQDQSCAKCSMREDTCPTQS
jgi:hypothetical protein